MPAGILITSILANNKHLNFSFHLFALSIDNSDKQRFKSLNCTNAEIKLYTVSEQFNKIKYVGRSDIFPHSSILRLLIPDFLKDVDNLLYLDCDMICNGSLSELLNLDISNHIAACVLETASEQLAKEIGLNNKNYFNSGMLYINVKKWINECVSEQSLAIIGKNKYKYLIKMPLILL